MAARFFSYIQILIGQICFFLALSIAAAVIIGCPLLAWAEDDTAVKENWTISPQFEALKPRTIAVLPMDNLSLEPEVEKSLYQAVYARLSQKGYSKIATTHVQKIMKTFGIDTPGQLAGISLKKLCTALGAEALLSGQVEQSAAIHGGVYDAVTVSCSLRLTHCDSGKTIWQAEQWRTAHRQWQIDPVNMLINVLAHEKSSRESRLAWLVQEMFKTLPVGQLEVHEENLFEKAQTLQATPFTDKDCQ